MEVYTTVCDVTLRVNVNLRVGSEELGASQNKLCVSGIISLSIMDEVRKKVYSIYWWEMGAV